MEKWIEVAVGRMHTNKITGVELAEYICVTPQYLSEILNGKKSPKGAKERILTAIDEIIASRR